LRRLVDEPRITIKIHGDVEPDVSSRLETLIADTGYDGLIVLNADNEMKIGDCHLEWSCGGAERNTAGLWQEIDNIIARNFAGDLMTAPEPEEAKEDNQDDATDESVPDQTSENIPETGEISEIVEVENDVSSAIPEPDLTPKTDV